MTTFYKGPPILLSLAIGIIAGAVAAPLISEKSGGSIAACAAFLGIFVICVAVILLLYRRRVHKRPQKK